jgi:hypothetical protein
MIENTPRGFFSALYDFSFHTFVTPKIIRVLYILALVIIGLWSLGFLISGFTPSYSFVGTSQPSPLVHIIGAPIMFVLGSILARVYLEFIIAVFNIAENTRKT